jgi:hypothetical protein
VVGSFRFSKTKWRQLRNSGIRLLVYIQHQPLSSDPK